MPRVVAVAAVLLAAAGLAAAQGVCRPNMLGTVSCPAPPPEPRPVYEADTQAIDRVRRRPGPQAREQTFVPAWRTNRLGTTPQVNRTPGPCRADSFGNLRCP